MDLTKSMQLSAAGMKAQSTRLRVIAENLANTDSLASEPGGEPYRRKVITFKSVLDRSLGMPKLSVDKISLDQSRLERRYDPKHPGADKDGYVQLPNVNGLLEIMDMRQAQRGYDANLSVIELARSMLMRTIDVLRG